MSKSTRSNMRIWLFAAWFAFTPALHLRAEDTAQTFQIRAVVNGDVITNDDINRRMELMIALSGLPDEDEVRKKMYRQVMQKLIDEQLQMQEAKKNQISVSPADMQLAYEQVAKRLNSSLEEMGEKLTAMGINRDELDRQIETEVSWTKFLLQKARPAMRVNDSEIDDAIEAKSGDTGFDEWEIASITLPVATPENDKDAASLAKDLAKQIEDGADVEKLAAQFRDVANADSTETKRWINAGDSDAAITKWLRTASRGDVSPIIRTALGYQLVKLYDKRRMLGADIADTEVALKQIIFPVAPEDGVETAKKQYKLAQTTARDIQGCSDFLPKGRALESANAHDLGRLQIRHLAKEIGDIVRPLPVGKVSAAFRTPMGIHLMIVCERIMPRSVPIDRDQIKRQIENRKLGLEALKLMRNIRRSAIIEARKDG